MVVAFTNTEYLDRLDSTDVIWTQNLYVVLGLSPEIMYCF